jgi:hypothetical protein
MKTFKEICFLCFLFGFINSVFADSVSLEKPQRESAFYFSTQGFITPIHTGIEFLESYYFDICEFGLNISAGKFTKRFLVSGELALICEIDKYTGLYASGLGSGALFGYIIQPTEWFQVIPGISAGLWGSDVSFYFGGVFVKTLFGKDKKWFEFQHRILFGMTPYDIGMSHKFSIGITRAPSKKIK